MRGSRGEGGWYARYSSELSPPLKSRSTDDESAGIGGQILVSRNPYTLAFLFGAPRGSYKSTVARRRRERLSSIVIPGGPVRPHYW
jgi:hypothetical protein